MHILTPHSLSSARRIHMRNHMATYLRRLFKPRQWDLEWVVRVIWHYCPYEVLSHGIAVLSGNQLIYSLALARLYSYRHTAYHKQTKNQWARDDPAFVVVCCILVASASLAYCVTFGNSLKDSVIIVLSAVLVDFLVLGVSVATACWLITNRFLRKRSLHHHQVEQNVEWLYAFDVHCNSFFPFFLLMYVLQFILSPVLLWPGSLSSALSNALYAISVGLYNYLTFLGYSALPFLDRTEVFLWPFGLMLLLLPFTVLTGFNPSRFNLGVYF